MSDFDQNSENISSLFLEGLQHLGLYSQRERLITAFLLYRTELLEWNNRFNLTAIKDPDEILIKHFLDSLSLLPVCQQLAPQPINVLDIGSGAGFPGLPLKLAAPDWHVTLLEATGKKITFLQHMIDVLQLNTIEVVNGRAEELAHQKKYRAHFDIVTARAVSAFPVLLEYCVPYCRPGGMIVLPKKGELTEELERGRRAARYLGATLQEDIPVTLPGLSDGRRLFIWQQTQNCPSSYPRSGAAITKKPLA